MVNETLRDANRPILLTLLGCFVLSLIAFLLGDTVVSIVCGSLSLTLAGLAATLHMTRGKPLVTTLSSGQLGPWFAVSTAIVFGVASLIWIAPPAPYSFLVTPSGVLTALFVVAVALLCFTAGYSIAFPGPTNGAAHWMNRVIVTNRTLRLGQRIAWLLLGVALVGYLGEIAIGRFGYLSNPAAAVSSGNPFAQLLFVLSNFSVFAVALSANDYARSPRKGPLASLAALLAIQSIVGAFSADKEIVALGFAAALFGYAVGGRRLPIAWIVAAIFIFVFVVVPFTTSYRNEVLVGGSRLSPLQVIQTVSKRGLAFFGPTQLGSPAMQTLQRVSRIGDVAVIVQLTPEAIGYRPLGELFEAPFLGLIPRLVWPDKPVLASGYEFSQQYLGARAGQYSSAAVTPEGDLWRHGGWLVVVVGMLIFGAGVKILDTSTIDVTNAPVRLLTVLTFFPLIVKHEADAVFLLASVPSLLVGIAVASRLVTSKVPLQRNATASSAATPRVVIAVNQPIQHFSASFRYAAQSKRVRASVLYWADNSSGMFDSEFDRHVVWDVDLLSGYPSQHANGANVLSRALSFIRAMNALSPDVVVCFGWASPAALLTTPWCFLGGTPIVFYGDTSLHDTSTGLRLWLRNAALRVIFRFAAGALSTGTFNREFYLYHGIHPGRIVDSVYPIDVASYSAARGPRHESDRQLVIGFAGKLIARKGVDELLQALHLLANDGSWTARIIGDGEEADRLRTLSDDLGIASRVDFRGFRNTSQMPSELSACDIVVVPSKHDNRGMIAAEAMSAGAVVIVSSNTGVWGRGDLVQDGVSGRVYRSGDPNQLAMIIKQLLHTPTALSSLKDEGARRAAEHGPDSFTRALEQAAVVLARHD